ncbi:MAG TPA: hypothetical protein VNT55_23015 [Baekduia sp.]|nr:hypothetical protein [Baekduia sp.]
MADELVAALELFLEDPDGHAAARVAGESIGPGAALSLRTHAPEATLRLVLGEAPRVERGESGDVAPVEVTIDANTLHDLMVDHLGAGHIARAIELKEIHLDGSPHALDAVIVLAGSLGGCYRRSLEARGRHDLLATPVPPPPGDWMIDVVGPELFIRDVIGGRHKRNERESRGGQGDPDRPPVHP